MSRMTPGLTHIPIWLALEIVSSEYVSEHSPQSSDGSLEYEGLCKKLIYNTDQFVGFCGYERKTL
jgi:hypothetical protein